MDSTTYTHADTNGNRQRDPEEKEAQAGSGGFTCIPNAVLWNAGLSRNARLTYAILASYAWGDKNQCYPGQRTLAALLGCSERKVRDYIRELEDAGYVEKQHRPLHDGNNQTDLYTLKPSTSSTDRNHSSDPDRNPASYPERNHSSYEEDEVEENKINNPPGGSAPEDFKAKEQEGLKDDTKPDNAAPSTKDWTSRAVADLRDVAGVDLRNSEKKRNRIAHDVDAAIRERGATPEELEATVKHFAARWKAGAEIRFLAALTDVRNDDVRDDGAGKGSPPEVVEAIRTYTRPKRHAPGDRTSGAIAACRKELAKVAERWDFTSEEEPPMPIRLEISENKQECDEMIPRLRKIARRVMRKKDERHHQETEEERAFRERYYREMRETEEAALRKMDLTEVEMRRALDQLNARYSSSTGHEGTPEGSTTPQEENGSEAPNRKAELDALIASAYTDWDKPEEYRDALQSLVEDEDTRTGRLARAVRQGKRSGDRPITIEDIARAAVAELDLSDTFRPEALVPLLEEIIQQKESNVA